MDVTFSICLFQEKTCQAGKFTKCSYFYPEMLKIIGRASILKERTKKIIKGEMKK
ncbi:hypothetical protein CHCC15075_1706 [Bacillus licheniformis]|nr:hypothetical protein CHCC15075_1706 [Bacillus licheniformis]